MTKQLKVGDEARVVRDDVVGTVIATRAADPELRFAYVLRIDLGSEVVEWGYHAAELEPATGGDAL